MPAVTLFRAAATAITSQHVSNTSPLLAPSVVAAFAAYREHIVSSLAGVLFNIRRFGRFIRLNTLVTSLILQISDTGYFIQPFLERHDFIGDLIYFVPGAITRSPAWFIMIYCYFAYIGIVKNKDFPHFFRFHLMMGMLLETALQILLYTSNFFPLIHYNGRFGMYYWAGVGFSYITILLQCVRFALAGDYAHLSFVSDAAYVILCLTLEVTTDLSRFLSAEKRKIHRACMFRLEGLIQERTTRDSLDVEIHKIRSGKKRDMFCGSHN